MRYWNSVQNTMGRFLAPIFSLFCLVGFYTPAWSAPLPEADDIQVVPIVTGLANAVDFEISPSGQIFILNRFGAVSLYNPQTQTTTEALKLDVYSGIEAGLNGIALDPNYTQNQYLYLYYSPLSPKVNRVSRFTFNGSKIVTSSEKILLEIPVDRLGGNHDGGNLEFDSAGNLLIGTGDDTLHSSYAPLNESSRMRSAEKSSSNSQDLRGKILRIRPQSNGTYSIPSGNLFTNANDGKPEIYIMGARNPYKFFIDPITDALIWADIGPDANNASAQGPAGKDEINWSEAAGNYGWPYFVGDNLAYYNSYNNYYFDPLRPTNDSKWNTGLKVLPPAMPAWITLARSSYMVGPIYHFDNGINNPARLPSVFDNYLFYWDFNNSKVWYVELDFSGNILNTHEWTALSKKGQGFIDFELGPNGQLYVLAYGTGCCDFDVGNGVLSRVDYVGDSTNLSPVALMTTDTRYGDLPLTVNFSSTGSYDPDGDAITIGWDFDADGTVDANTADATYTYYSKGNFSALLKVTDEMGAETTASTLIRAGNNVAEFDFIWPPAGSFFDWNELVDVDVDVQDSEDGSISGGTIACSAVSLVPSLGHLDHAHDKPGYSRCNPTVALVPDDHEPNGEDDLYYRLQAGYRDQDGLDSFSVISLYPKRSPMEYADLQQGVIFTPNTDTTYGAVNAVRVNSNDAFLALQERNLAGINGVEFRLGGTASNQSIELRLDGPDGELLARIDFAGTGSNNQWQTLGTDFIAPSGTHDLYITFPDFTTGQGSLNVLSIEFTGNGVSYPAPTATDTNQALNKPTVSSSVQSGDTQSFGPQYGVDGDLSTRWASVKRKDPQTYTLDLADTITISEVNIYWEGAYAKAYQLQVSDDGSSWQTVFTETAGNGGTDSISLSGVEASYVRLLMTKRGTFYGYSFWELEVIGHSGSAIADPVLTDLTISPTATTVTSGQAVQFQTQGQDQYGSPIDTAVNWTVSGGGYIDGNGRLTATTVGGPYLVTATATSDSSIRATATYQVSAPATGGNLALGKSGIASSMENNDASSFSPRFAFDGDLSTRWASVFRQDPQWVGVDLGAITSINQVKITWEAAYATSYQIQVSNDQSSWITVTTISNSNGGEDTVDFAATNARYVRVLGTSRATRYGYSIWEMEVYGPQSSPGEGDGSNLALNSSVTVSSMEDASFPAALAVDGDRSTRWSSEFGVDPQWIQVDFGSSAHFNQVQLHWERARATSYKIQISNDGTNWQSIYSTTTGSGNLDTIEFDHVSTKFLRIYCEKRSTKYGYSLWEVEVFHTD